MTTEQKKEIIGLLNAEQCNLGMSADLHDWRAAMAAAQQCAKLAAYLMVAEQEGQ